MAKTLFQGRYLLLLMSIFGIYAGFLYNECFSIPFNFGTTWAYNSTAVNGTLDPNPINYPPWSHNSSHTPRFYAFGVDPAWKGSVNELTYYNSLKMKLSILMGVSQMTLGIVLSLLNAIHFRKPYDAYFEFLPQIVWVFFIHACCLLVC